MNRTLFFVVVVVLILVDGAPLPAPKSDLDKIIEEFLDGLYDRIYGGGSGGGGDGGDIYDQMQGDQAANTDNNIDLAKMLSVNFSTNHNMTEYFRTSRDRAKENWIHILKENILLHMGRSNATTVKINETPVTPFNVSIINNLLNNTVIEDDHITEKIRSYYPSCDVPANMDQDVWKDDNVMNLYFNTFDQVTDEKGLNIATATLRLYRVPSENSTKTAGKLDDCDSSASVEEDRLLRVSIYWYTVSVRKKKVKRRLSDSKVIQENARWVELSVKPATKAWSRGRNLGLAVLVEDQEGNVLKANKLFKGALCMVGASTPKPIPTIIIDKARKSNEFNEPFHNILGGNSTSALFGDVSMLPIIDICTLEFPENYSQTPAHIANLRINACNLKKSHEHAQLQAERDRLERLATLPELLSQRHIRHQRQHLRQNDFDPRSNIINKRILSPEELQTLNINITAIDR